MLTTQTGTPYYAPPEIWLEKPYDAKSDVWSFGCAVYEMCCLVPPFQADDMGSLFKRVLKGSYPSLPTHFSHDMRDLIKAMLTPHANERPSTSELLKMEIVQKRIKKYFSDKDGSLIELMRDTV